MPADIEPSVRAGTSDTTLEISKADMAAIVEYVVALQQWVLAAQPCLEKL